MTLRNGLLTLRPEIYGSISDPEKVELDGMVYALERLPEGIEQCRFIRLVADEGLRNSGIPCIVPRRRRRNCYRIDEEQMYVEITRGRSDIYDVLTHLTFLYNEADKIMNRALRDERIVLREWHKLKQQVLKGGKLSSSHKEIYLSYLATILGRTYDEVKQTYLQLATKDSPDRFLEIVYWLGEVAIKERLENEKREIFFSAILREQVGHHLYGGLWSKRIKEALIANDLADREVHIISANMHSVMNTLYAEKALESQGKGEKGLDLFVSLSQEDNHVLREKVRRYALSNGMIEINDESGANIDVQLFDLKKTRSENTEKNPVIVVMDYAFGEQAFETMDELLKPLTTEEGKQYFKISSISIMGKAGILCGDKGDIMIPSAHMFEGTADNYPFENALGKRDFAGSGLPVFEGTMVTVLGTSLQNKDLLSFLNKSSWNAVGLEMEGAYYQKAIQAASRIRKNIDERVVVRYAYYASDNPLKTGSTLASGPLGEMGVKPTYLITEKIVEQILGEK